jgi:amino acid permease
MSVTIFCVICLGIFALPNKAFAWVQYIGSMVKVLLFLMLVPLCLALIAGAGPTGSVHDGRTWTSLSPFKNGIKVSVVRKTDTMIYWLTVCRDLPTVLSSPSGPSEIKSSSESWEEKPNSLAGL